MLRRWALTNDFAHSRRLSHALMDGGVLSIPGDRIPDFHEVYCAAVNAGERVFVVEQKTPVYNFFADLDYKAPDALTLEDIEDVCRVICAKVGNLGGGDCVVSVSEPKPVGNDLVKTGVHLNWPGFVVDQKSACALREHVLVALYTAKPGVDWAAVVDESVYGDPKTGTRGSGFRLPWSHKRAKGGVIEGPYLPVFRWTRKPLSTMLRLDSAVTPRLLADVTVRVDDDAVEPSVVHPPSKVTVTTTSAGAFSKAQTKDEIRDDVLSAHLETFVRTTMAGQASARVTKIFKHKDQFLISTNSKYCENIGREHGSNHVWFYASGDVIAQKCFCRCETLDGRRDGFCKDFLGTRYTLPADVRRMLYPRPPAKTIAPLTKKKKPPRASSSSTPLGEARAELQSFIRTYAERGCDDAQVMELKKVRGGWTVTTNAACTSCKRTTAFTLKKDILTRVCECTNSSRLQIFSSTYKKLTK